MKLKIFTLTALFIMACATASAQRSFLSNYGVSANAGLSGAGFSLSTPLHKNFNLRAGYEFPVAKYNYTIDNGDYTIEGLDDINQAIADYDLGNPIVGPDVDLKGKLAGGGFHMLVDYNPFKGGLGGFHLTGGFYVGGSKLIVIDGQFERQFMERLAYIDEEFGQLPPGSDVPDIDIESLLRVEVGDAIISTDASGRVNAYAKVSSFKPYFGFGWGNAIPRGRVGFRFDLGVMFHGKPKIESPNMVGNLEDEDVDEFNKMISKISVWPQMTFQITYKLFKEDSTGKRYR